MLSRYKGERYKEKASPTLVAFVESDRLHTLDFDEVREIYSRIIATGTTDDLAYLGAVDRYFLLVVICGRSDALHPWLYDRCREVELEPDGFIDLWSRFHYKSTIITFAGGLQEIINDPEIRIGIFSHTQAIAKKFVAQIKREFESNAHIRTLYPNLCWVRPKSEAPIWSESAFTVRRKGNPKEATVEGYGVVKGQPTSKHFPLMVYDDLVTLESVTTPEQVERTTDAFQLSTNLGTNDTRRWIIGTRYSFMDSYAPIITSETAIPRIYPATHNGKLDGKPVLLTQKEWDTKKREQASTVAAQMLQNPLSGKERTFQPKWLRPWFVRPRTLNVYIMADPSRGRTAKSDRTAIAVIGIDAAGNKYLLDGARHRMKLSLRWDTLKSLHQKWSKQIGVNFVKVGYERYGQQSDDEYFAERMMAENYSFAIEELAWPREGGQSKQHRVERLQPDFQFSSFFLPGLVGVGGKANLWEPNEDEGIMQFSVLEGELSQHKELKRTNEEHLACKPILRRDEDNKVYDVTRALMEEMLYFPFGTHDDLVDAASRIYDMEPMPALINDGDVDDLPETPD